MKRRKPFTYLCWITFLCVGTMLACSAPPQDLNNPAQSKPQAGLGKHKQAMLGAGFVLRTVSNAVARQAVCNDGTPARYYIRRATDPSSDRKWVIHLRGKENCTSVASCEARSINQAQLMTSNGLPATPSVGGIFSQSSTINPNFHDWNHVYVHYCSSDNWIGDREFVIPPPTPQDPHSGAFTGRTLRFRGFNIVRAVFSDLSDPMITEGKNLSDADFVMFTGSNTGATGMRNHLDFMNNTALPQAIVRGIADGNTFRSPTLIFGTPSTSPANFAFWGARPDASCVAANSGNPSLCLDDNVLIPEVTTFHLTFMDQEDKLVVTRLGLNSAAQINTLANDIKAFVSPFTALYSPRNANGSTPTTISEGQGWPSALTFNSRFTATMIPSSNLSLRDIINNVYFASVPPFNISE